MKINTIKKILYIGILNKKKLLKSIKELNFSLSWRPYQATVLNNFDKHINDNHFHIVAPPGSGKTILGIEILRRIGKKTLVLSPTLTIRNQWNDRLQEFFTDNSNFSNISFDIKSPSDITFSTYQGLHSFFKSFKCQEDYLSFFKEHDIETLVLDEAHHLKNEWWKCLYQLKQQNKQTVVALTATPPYDSDNNEIHKYFDLCGEIDDEIVVPDLVKEKNLCPHQDLIFFSEPLDKEINFITDFRLKISNFVDDLLGDKAFITLIKQHRFYSKTEENLEELYKYSEFFSSLLIFLNESGILIPREKLEILGFENNEIIDFPKINNQWIQILLQHLLVTDRQQLIESETYLLPLEKKLKRLSVFSKNKVNLIGNNLLYKSLTNSPSKLKSIVTIVKQEEKNLLDNLQCVILSDYIRKEYLNINDSSINDIQKLGVLPIFLNLKREIKYKHNLAVLTGSLVIIHSSLISKLGLIDTIENYSYVPLKSDSEFVILNSKSTSKKTLVETITELFELGYIKVLVGTKSLLGEGWDAPSINSLILASVVGSFVTSNQMRGRAIRINNSNKNKTALIWHLACIDTTDEFGGKDYGILSKRFDAFLGISNDEKTIITNGIDRLNLENIINSKTLALNNNKTINISKNRNIISKKWNEAIIEGNSLSKEIKLLHRKDKRFLRQKRIYFQDILKYSLGEITIGLAIYLPQYLIKNFNIIIHKGLHYFIYSLITGLGLTFGYKIYKALQMYFRYGLIHKKVDKIALTIIDSLYDLNYMTTNREEIIINTELLQKGDIICTINNANRYENNLFISALQDVLAPINNPKYLIIKTNWLRKKINVQNFFPVPTLFSNRKNDAIKYQTYWQFNISKSKLMYTRTLEGRKLLLKSKIFHIDNIKKGITTEALIWK